MATDNVTFSMHVRKQEPYVESSNVMHAQIIAVPRTVLPALSSVIYDTYFDGTTVRRVRIS